MSNLEKWIMARQGAAELDVVARDMNVSVRQANSSPAVMAVAKSQGVWLEDVTGRRYIDFYGNNCHHVGHCHPAVTEAVTQQIRELAFTSRGQTNLKTVQLAELIRQIYPIADAKVMFAPGGSAAIEATLMLCKAHTGRHKTISFYGSYHGRSAGALSVGGRYRDRTARLGPMMPGALHVPGFQPESENAEQAARTSLAVIRTVFENERDIAALIGEPMRTGPTGPFLAPDWFWPEVRALCDRYDTLLIFDEVPGGLGKTGHLFNQSLVGVKPDVTVLGKSLAGGISGLSAAIVRKELDTTAELNIGYFTHEKNPTSAAAGLATLSTIVDGQLPAKVQAAEPDLHAQLLEIVARNPMIAQVRHKGFMFSFDVIDPATQMASADLASHLYRACIDSGLLPLPIAGTALSFSAPLVTSADEMSEALDRFQHAADSARDAR